jgi:hypothetical protein
MDIGTSRPRFYIQFERNIAALGDAIILLMDGTDRDRAIEAVCELYYLLYRRNEGCDDGDGVEKRISKNVPILILVTKQDQEVRWPDDTNTRYTSANLS